MNENVREWEGRKSGDSPYNFDFVFPFSKDDEWTLVTNRDPLGPLDSSVTIRVRRSSDGRYIVTGLLIGDVPETEAASEVNAKTLRAIKIADIVRHMTAGYSPDDRTVWAIAVPASDTTDATFWEFFRQWEVTRGIPNEPTILKHSGRTKPDEEYREFAARYLHAYATQPHRALMATRETYGFRPGTRTPLLSRGTANNWLTVVRERGWVPSSKESKND